MSNKSRGRAKDRLRKTLSLPEKLVETIQAEADKKYGGDFTRTIIEKLASMYPEAKKFLKTNTTFKHSTKKF